MIANGLQTLQKLTGEFGNILAPVCAVVLTIGLLASSVEDLEPGQVAVRVNNISGDQTAITQPGWIITIPFIQSVNILDASPHTFSMKGKSNLDDLHVRELTVRASDGSNFHFDDTTLIFQLNGDAAVTAIRDGGAFDGYRMWLKPYVRSILRDEFGRETTLNVSNPATYAQATNRAKKRLNDELEEHGIRITQLVTPRPRFNDAYEHAIEERNALGNQEQVIKSDLDRSETERSSRMAVVDQNQNKTIQEKRAEMESNLARAIAQQTIVKRQADVFYIDTLSQGQAKLSASIRQAEELKGELAAVYRSKKSEIDAFRNQPLERVMERLGERLKGVTIQIQPWANDASPRRVQYEEIHRDSGE
jgi:hypothetical protein